MFMKISALLASLLMTSSAFAFDLAAGLMAPEQQKVMLNYSGIGYGIAENDSDSLTSQFQSFSAFIPLYKSKEQAFAFTAASSQMTLSPPRANIHTLTDTNFGFSYTKKIDEMRTWTVSAQYGSASDKAFDNESVNTLNATAFYAVPRDKTSSWLYVINYSNNRNFLNNIPIPGIAYLYNPDRNFRAVYGLPFVSIYNKFHQNWSVDFFTLMPWRYRGALNYHVNDFIRLYTGFNTGPETWLLHDRTNRRERLFYDEKRLFVGARAPAARWLMAELEAGHAFDRRFSKSENYELSPEESASVGNAFYIKTSLRAFF